MQLFKKYVPVAIKNIPVCAEEIKVNVNRVEQVVAAYYGVPVQKLTLWREDSDAKIMTCFLLRSMYEVSVPTLAAKYNIYGPFLQNFIDLYWSASVRDCQLGRIISQLKNEVEQPFNKAD